MPTVSYRPGVKPGIFLVAFDGVGAHFAPNLDKRSSFGVPPGQTFFFKGIGSTSPALAPGVGPAGKGLISEARSLGVGDSVRDSTVRDSVSNSRPCMASIPWISRARRDARVPRARGRTSLTGRPSQKNAYVMQTPSVVKVSLPYHKAQFGGFPGLHTFSMNISFFCRKKVQSVGGIQPRSSEPIHTSPWKTPFLTGRAGGMDQPCTFSH
jgi:hypothetical protein